MKSLKISRSYWAGSYRIRLLLGTLIALVVSDGLVSKFLVTQRFAREGNPLLQIWVGQDIFLVIKLVGAFLAALVLWDIHKHNPKLSLISTSCFVISYTIIVFWSLYVFFVTQL